MLPSGVEAAVSFCEEQDVSSLRYKHENTVLHELCKIDASCDVVKLIIEHNGKVHVNSQNKFKQTPLHFVLDQQYPSMKVVKLLLENKASLVENVENYLGNTPFLHAAKENQLEGMKFLHSYAEKTLGIDLINQTASNGRTALHNACANGRIQAIEFLLSNRANINAPDQDNQSALFSAIRSQTIEPLEILLEDPSINLMIRNKSKGLSVLHLVCGKQSKLGFYQTEQILKAIKGPRTKILRLRDRYKRTPLFSTIIYNTPKTMELLLKYNASLNDRDSTGGTPLFTAVRRGNMEAVRMILSRTPNVNLQDKENRTALYYAKSLQNQAITNLLLEYNATEIPSPLQKRSRPLSMDNDSMINFRSVKVYEQIGAGAFGRVFRGEWLGTTVAIKFFSYGDEKQKKMFSSEVELLKSLNHPNIVNCYGDYISENGEPCMLMEYVPLTLTSVIESHNISMEQIISIMKAIASGMVYLHSKKIIHRDLKPSNILMTANLEPKIADFGISRSCVGVATMTSIGTPLYMAPEIINDKKYCESVDVFSFALMFLQLFTKKKLYYELGNKQALNIVFQVVKNDLRPIIPPTVPEDISLLLQNSWKKNPEERPSFVEIAAFLESKQAPSFAASSNTVNMETTVILDETKMISSQ